ncbi:MAG: T9SS type A sorting domain-containing protein [Bacteroidetes bacterium]|nr:T9SS type A sorting domain-containing protein [Bacteroidota bacterium]
MKQKFILLFSSLICCLQVHAQLVGHTTITFVDSSRNNRPIETEIYYPAITAGNNTPIAAGVFPLITFGHGFVMTWSAYQNFWDVLVPMGYIMAFPTTEGGFSPTHAAFAEDLRFLITKIQSSGAGADIPSSSVGPKSAIMGHSMGGGCSFLGAQNNTTITTMVSFAAANTNPSSITASQQIAVPTLLFSGVNDCVTPPSQHQDIMYDSTSAAYKTQINIIGGGHCFFANSNFNCTFGEASCSPSPTITRESQQLTTNDFLKIWLAYFLKDDCPKAQEFQDSLAASARITYRQNQPISCATGINEYLWQNPSTVYPNPFSNSLTVELPKGKIQSVTIYNIMMQDQENYVFTEPNSKVTLDLTSLHAGIHFIQINNTYWTKIVKQTIQ